MRISDWSSDVCSSDLGTNIVKLFVHTTQQEQDERLAARLSTPWKSWKTGTEDYSNRARREEYLAAKDEMFRLHSTRWATWQVVDGNDKKAATLSVLADAANLTGGEVQRGRPGVD